MMDIKDLIRWLLPVSNKLITIRVRLIDMRVALIVLCLLFNSCAGFVAKESRGYSLNRTSVVPVSSSRVMDKQSDVHRSEERPSIWALAESENGRTFGRPFKKMIAGLLPVVFQLGMASSWAVVGALVGIKTLFVAVMIFKMLLLGLALKVGSLFSAKHGPPHGAPHGDWGPGKEVHLHIHNGHPGTPGHEGYPGTDDAYSAWNREGQAQTGVQQYPEASAQQPQYVDPKTAALASIVQQYQGPQTISTPYGHYVKVVPTGQLHARRRRSQYPVLPVNTYAKPA